MILKPTRQGLFWFLAPRFACSTLQGKTRVKLFWENSKLPSRLPSAPAPTFQTVPEEGRRAPTIALVGWQLKYFPKYFEGGGFWAEAGPDTCRSAGLCALFIFHLKPP